MQRRMEPRIKSVLHLIRLWPTCQQPTHPPYLRLSFHLFSVPLRHRSEGHPLSYHLFLHRISVLPLLLAAQSLHHLPPFLQQSIPILFHDVTFLWAHHVLSLLVVPAAASFENASTTQDL